MKTYRNNHKRSRFRSNDRNFKRNGDSGKYNLDYSSNVSFQRKVLGRNNHNASNLIDKYNDLAREALSNEDKILSENYFQHADHFMRIFRVQENAKIVKISEQKSESNTESITNGTNETNSQSSTNDNKDTDNNKLEN